MLPRQDSRQHRPQRNANALTIKKTVADNTGLVSCPLTCALSEDWSWLCRDITVRRPCRGHSRPHSQAAGPSPSTRELIGAHAQGAYEHLHPRATPQSLGRLAARLGPIPYRQSSVLWCRRAGPGGNRGDAVHGPDNCRGRPAAAVWPVLSISAILATKPSTVKQVPQGRGNRIWPLPAHYGPAMPTYRGNGNSLTFPPATVGADWRRQVFFGRPS